MEIMNVLKPEKFKGIADRARTLLERIEGGDSRIKLVGGSAEQLELFMELKMKIREIAEKADSICEEIGSAIPGMGKLKESVFHRDEFKRLSKELYISTWEIYGYEPMPGETTAERRTREKARKLKEARDEIRREQAAVEKTSDGEKKGKGGFLESIGQFFEDLEWGW